MIIDSHVHIGRWMEPWRSDDALADLVATAHVCGIERLCVSSLGEAGYTMYPTPEELRAANDYVLEASERFPEALLGLCYVSPQYPHESVDEIRRCVEDGPMVGIKLWVACKASDSAVDPIMAEAARLGVPVVQHAWYKTTGNLPHESAPADVAVMAQRHPGVVIQMAHLHGAGERGVRDIAPYSNVVVDTSGGDPEAGLLEYAVEELGADRLVFGSDVPGRDFSVQLGKILGADLTDEQCRLILGGNIGRILGLKAES